MKKYDFNYLTDSEGDKFINENYNRIQELLNNGTVTQQEAIFMFQKIMMKTFKRKAFDICTNVDIFVKK